MSPTLPPARLPTTDTGLRGRPTDVRVISRPPSPTSTVSRDRGRLSPWPLRGGTGEGQDPVPVVHGRSPGVDGPGRDARPCERQSLLESVRTRSDRSDRRWCEGTGVQWRVPTQSSRVRRRIGHEVRRNKRTHPPVVTGESPGRRGWGTGVRGSCSYHGRLVRYTCPPPSDTDGDSPHSLVPVTVLRNRYSKRQPSDCRHWSPT